MMTPSCASGLKSGHACVLSNARVAGNRPISTPTCATSASPCCSRASSSDHASSSGNVVLSRRRRVACLALSGAVSSSTDTTVQDATVADREKTVPRSSSWEIDFCSRPLLDERGKKVWELLICDPERTFEYAQYFPNSRINSAELKRTIETLLSQPGAQKPDKARFFRGQMQTIISKALNEVDIKPVPSRRCFTVMSWLTERNENVYKTDPRYNDKAQSMFQLDLGVPEPLPDALRGEKWAFVQLPLGTVMEMLQRVGQGDMFGSTLSLEAASAADLPSNILVPGVAVFSRRSLPLAAWTNGLEIARVKADVERSCLILETGVNQRWRYGGWKATEDSIGEAEGWEEAKKGVKGLHFLAVQPDAESEELNGMWLLQDREPPAI